MIEAKHIIKRYGDLEVLRGVDVTIGEAEVVTIVGPSGAGKTTLLQIIGTLDREKRDGAYQRAKELLDYLHLTDRLEHKPAQLSGGERQRVAVARALINRPKVILADEPSGSLDTANKQELHRLFFQLRDEMKQTFVIVTHDETLAGEADRILRMQDGIIIDNNVQ